MTSTMTSFGRREHGILSAAIIARIKDLEDEFGVDLGANGGTVGHEGGVIKLKVSIRDTGAGKSAAQTRYERYAHVLGMKPEWFDKTFRERDGDLYKIVDINMNAPKFPVLIERYKDGKIFKSTPAGIIQRMS